jgi:MFS family permease
VGTVESVSELTESTPSALVAPSSDPEIVRRTQRIDLARSIPTGLVQPLEASLILTIAIKQFDAAGWVKGLIAAGAGFGLLASPFLTAAARRSKRPSMVVASTVSVVGALGFAAAALGSLWLLVIGAVIGLAANAAPIPLLTAMYQRNFDATDRGRRVGRGMTVRVLVSALGGLAMGALLRNELSLWWLVPVVGAVSMVTIAWTHRAFPSDRALPIPGHTSVLPHFHLVAEDGRLRRTLTAWMIMGFGNLMLLPLRVEYLTVPRYGIEADASTVALLTVTIPSVVRLLCTPGFGTLFDRLSFFSSRIAVNLLFALYVAAFFSGSSMVGLVIGSVVFGVAAAGGDLMWSLWVTKFAPPDRLADYMGLHTFFTGVRGVIAPMFGFLIIERTSLTTVAWLAAGAMLAASFVLLRDAIEERRPTAD